MLSDPAARRDLFVMLSNIETRLSELERNILPRGADGASVVLKDSSGNVIVEIGVFDDAGTDKVGIRITDPAGPTVLFDESVNY